MSIKQRQIKIETRIKLNPNIDKIIFADNAKEEVNNFFFKL